MLGPRPVWVILVAVALLLESAVLGYTFATAGSVPYALIFGTVPIMAGATWFHLRQGGPEHACSASIIFSGQRRLLLPVRDLLPPTHGDRGRRVVVVRAQSQLTDDHQSFLRPFAASVR